MSARSSVPAHARKPRAPRGVILTGPALLAVVLVAMVLTAGAPPAVPGRHAASAARDAAVTVTTRSPGISLAAQEQTLREQAVSLAWYTVRPGDSLSGIAAERCGAARDWTGLYAANRGIVGRDPDELTVAARLHIECTYVPGLLRAADPPVYRAAVAALADVTPASTGHVNPAGYSGFEACVITRESGGNPAAVNHVSGAGGLFGFLPSTWSALGFSGLPEDAPVAMQDRAFAEEYAKYGASPWSASDGC